MTDQVKDYLRSVGEAKLDAQRCKEKLRRLESQATRVTSQLSDMPKGGGAGRNSLLAALGDIYKEYAEKLVRSEQTLSEVEEFINELPTVTSRVILKLRYCDGLDWNKVNRRLRAAGYYYEERQIFNLHGLALREARELYEEKHDKR